MVLPQPDIVSGHQREYTRHGLLAGGDIADLWLASDSGGGAYLLKTSREREGQVLLESERRMLARLHRAAEGTTWSHYLPSLVESFLVRAPVPQRVNVFLYDPDFRTLEQVHAQHPALDGRHLAWIFKRLLTVLGFCHAQGIVHGAVLPGHVLIHPQNHGLRLIGWGASVIAGRSVKTVSPRHEPWYPPEVHRKQPATAATDLFLAARCMSYLAGGDPTAGRMPDAVPLPMQRFLGTCLLEGAAMRPNDAWKLIEEFDDLLRRLYGPPQFHPLVMT
jgi:serine/threonine protein kinase